MSWGASERYNRTPRKQQATTLEGFTTSQAAPTNERFIPFLFGNAPSAKACATSPKSAPTRPRVIRGSLRRARRASPQRSKTPGVAATSLFDARPFASETTRNHSGSGAPRNHSGSGAPRLRLCPREPVHRAVGHVQLLPSRTRAGRRLAAARVGALNALHSSQHTVAAGLLNLEQ